MEVTHWGPGAKSQQDVWGQVPQKLVIFCKLILRRCNLEESKTVFVNIALLLAVLYNDGGAKFGDWRSGKALVSINEVKPTLSPIGTGTEDRE